MKCNECLIKDSCQLRAITNSSCGKPITADTLIPCDICGNLIPTTQVVYDDGKVICPGCHTTRSICGSCIHSATCLFATDPDPIPKVVVQQMRNGNTVIQQQVRNPAREEKFCKNCKCYNEEFHCMRPFLSRCSNFMI